MNQSEKQFSFTRAASSTSGRKNQILISCVLLKKSALVTDGKLALSLGNDEAVSILTAAGRL